MTLLESGVPFTATEYAEVIRLRRGLAKLQEDSAFFGKAAGHFATAHAYKKALHCIASFQMVSQLCSNRAAQVRKPVNEPNVKLHIRFDNLRHRDRNL